jgi:hypothetical protein
VNTSKQAHTTHFFNLRWIHLFAFPVVSLDDLSISLPLGKKADLILTLVEQFERNDRLSYNMNGVIDILVGSKFCFDVFVSENTFFNVQSPMGAKYTAI